MTPKSPKRPRNSVFSPPLSTDPHPHYSPSHSWDRCNDVWPTIVPDYVDDDEHVCSYNPCRIPSASGSKKIAKRRCRRLVQPPSDPGAMTSDQLFSPDLCRWWWTCLLKQPMPNSVGFGFKKKHKQRRRTSRSPILDTGVMTSDQLSFLTILMMMNMFA